MAGFLTKTNAATLHRLRFLGNEAVHEFLEAEIDELKIAIEILDLILESIYELHYKAERLKQKKNNRNV